MKKKTNDPIEEAFRDIHRLNIRFTIYRTVIYLLLIFLLWWVPQYTYKKMVREPMEQGFERILESYDNGRIH